jgi:hypothetical protein
MRCTYKSFRMQTSQPALLKRPHGMLFDIPSQGDDVVRHRKMMVTKVECNAAGRSLCDVRQGRGWWVSEDIDD